MVVSLGGWCHGLARPASIIGNRLNNTIVLYYLLVATSVFNIGVCVVALDLCCGPRLVLLCWGRRVCACYEGVSAGHTPPGRSAP